jgi:AbiV family abortive infection protein
MRSRAIKDLVQLSDHDFFSAVAQGLSSISENAARVSEAATILDENDNFRGSRVLESIAKEEAAKYLILLDAIRCPRKPEDRFSTHLRKFNDHLAKGLYAEVCNWRPSNFHEVKKLIKEQCHQHYLDGPNGLDWVFENWIIRQREEAFYVDYVEYEEEHVWLSPKRYEDISVPRIHRPTPTVVGLVADLERLGFSEPNTLSIVANIWRPVLISNNTKFAELRDLIHRTMRELHLPSSNEDLVCNRITEKWPFPLYDLEMCQINVKKSDLMEIQVRWYPEL